MGAGPVPTWLPWVPLLIPVSPVPSPTRLWALAASSAPETSPPDVWPATIVLVSVAVPEVNSPPPYVAELPLTVQLVSVVVPPVLLNRPPPWVPELPPGNEAELPLTVQLVSVV